MQHILLILTLILHLTTLPASIESTQVPVVEPEPTINYIDLVTDHQPNELGKTMIIMYHNLVDDPAKEGYYARTPENFRKDLERLYKEGYVPVTMTDLVTGNLDIGPGKTPVVLTFDDGHPSNFRYLEDGSIDPNCVIGIFEAMEATYSDFKGKAVFYVNQPVVFGDNPISDKKVKYLLDKGYELANHTSNHVNLTDVSLEKQRQAIVKQGEYLEGLTGLASFHFSVPFGQKPEGYFDRVKGDWLAPYTMISSVNVGWNPIVSPYDVDFDAHNLNRITVGEDQAELHFWLDEFVKKPHLRFVSDGDPNLITLPKAMQDRLNLEVYSDKQILIYEGEVLEWINTP